MIDVLCDVKVALKKEKPASFVDQETPIQTKKPSCRTVSIQNQMINA
jgi:hypothetical protein